MDLCNLYKEVKNRSMNMAFTNVVVNKDPDNYDGSLFDVNE